MFDVCCSWAIISSFDRVICLLPYLGGIMASMSRSHQFTEIIGHNPFKFDEWERFIEGVNKANEEFKKIRE